MGADGRRGLRVQTQRPAYVFCYAQPADGPMQRIFPNRFTPDARVEPNRPLLLPGAQPFSLPSRGALTVGCLAADRDVYRDAPAALRWGDFQALNAVRGLDDVRRMFEAVTKSPVALASVVLPAAEARP